MTKFVDYFISANRRVLLVVGFCVLAVYATSLVAPFQVLDDQTAIVTNESIRSFSNVPQLFTQSFFSSKSFYRPMVSLSYMIDYQIFGLNPFGFRLMNVLMHIINGYLVFILCLRLMNNRSLSFWSALIWAIHPIHWEAVATIPGRSNVLSTLFVLIAFIQFLKFHKGGPLKHLFTSVLCFTIALFTKESAGILPLLIASYVWIYRKEKKPDWSVVSFYFVVLGMFIFWRNYLGVTELHSASSAAALLSGFVSFLRGVLTYLRLMVIPSDLYFDRGQELLDLAHSEYWAVIIVFVLSVFLFIRLRRVLSPLALFCWTWFAIALLPVSQLVTSIGLQPGVISLAEHFMYFASIPIIILLLRVLLIKEEVTKKQGIILAGFALFFLLTSAQQSFYASNELAMYQRSLSFQPKNARIQYAVGLIFANAQMFDKAEPYFRQAKEMDPFNPKMYVAYGRVLCDLGRCEEGMEVSKNIQIPDHLKEMHERNLKEAWEKLHKDQ